MQTKHNSKLSKVHNALTTHNTLVTTTKVLLICCVTDGRGTHNDVPCILHLFISLISHRGGRPRITINCNSTTTSSTPRTHHLCTISPFASHHALDHPSEGHFSPPLGTTIQVGQSGEKIPMSSISVQPCHFQTEVRPPKELGAGSPNQSKKIQLQQTAM